MTSIDEIRQVRLEKVNKLRNTGVNPYPVSSEREFSNSHVFDNFPEMSREGKSVTLAGRVVSLRVQGALVFLNFFDGSLTFQGLVKKDEIGEDKFKFFVDTVDIGDFIQMTGTLFTTKTEQKTILVQEWKMLAKSLRPLPEKWHGLVDEEEKYRKRYLDILSNHDVRHMFEKKSKFWNSIRDFLIKRGFLEVETPILETTTGGGDARPFVTHHNALDMDVYLRISAGELWQKELMVAGFEKTFEIGRIFRNEGMSAEHLQDYTQMEFYWAYADHIQGMEMVEELYKYVAQETFGTLQFKIGEHSVDLGKKWEHYDYVETIKNYTNVDILNTDIDEIRNRLEELNIKFDKDGFNITRAIDNLWKYCRKQISGPGFLVGIPIEVSPLAKADENNRRITLRFQPIIAGSELGNGYSELNDPIDQENRFIEQERMREQGDEEAQMHAHDFIEAIEYGMPPTCGFGLSERLFAFLMDKSVRECQIFPLMRPKK